jgi:hypothetical protein
VPLTAVEAVEVLREDGKLAEELADKIETVAVVLLLPLFFAYSGLRTEIGLVSQPQEWLVTGIVILLATVGKFGGSALAARFTGLRWREASAIGILMNTRPDPPVAPTLPDRGGLVGLGGREASQGPPHLAPADHCGHFRRPGNFWR